MKMVSSWVDTPELTVSVEYESKPGVDVFTI